jgi:hypothetical protein
MLEQYYTPEQRTQIDQRAALLGEDRILAAEAEWTELIAAVRVEIDGGTDPSAPSVRDLARRWRGLVEEFTGGDAGISQSLGKIWNQEQNIQGIDTDEMRRMMQYIAKAG